MKGRVFIPDIELITKEAGLFLDMVPSSYADMVSKRVARMFTWRIKVSVRLLGLFI